MIVSGDTSEAVSTAMPRQQLRSIPMMPPNRQPSARSDTAELSRVAPPLVLILISLSSNGSLRCGFAKDQQAADLSLMSEWPLGCDDDVLFVHPDAQDPSAFAQTCLYLSLDRVSYRLAQCFSIYSEQVKDVLPACLYALQ